jgi:hypothetical protein
MGMERCEAGVGGGESFVPVKCWFFLKGICSSSMIFSNFEYYNQICTLEKSLCQ